MQFIGFCLTRKIKWAPYICTEGFETEDLFKRDKRQNRLWNIQSQNATETEGRTIIRLKQQMLRFLTPIFLQ